MKKLILPLMFLISLLAHSQASVLRWDAPVYTINSSSPIPGGLYPVLALPNVSTQICATWTTGTAACNSLALTYTDATGTAACVTSAQLTPSTGGACSGFSDASGDVGAWLPAGIYAWVVNASYGSFGPYVFSIGTVAGGTFTGNITGPSVTSSVNNVINVKAPPYNAQGNLLGFSGLTASVGATSITINGATQSMVGQTCVIWGAGAAYRNSFLSVAALIASLSGNKATLANLTTQPVNTTALGSGLTTAIPNASNPGGQFECGTDDTAAIQAAYNTAHSLGATVYFPAPGTTPGGAQFSYFPQAIDLSGGQAGSSNLTSRIGAGSVVTFITSFPGQDVFQWPDGKPIGAGYAEEKGLQIRLDDSVDVSCPTQTNCPQVGNGQTTFGRFSGINVAETVGDDYPAESSIVCTSGSAPFTCTMFQSNQLGGPWYPNTPIHFTTFTGALAPLSNTTQVTSVPPTQPVSVTIASMNLGTGYSGSWTCTVNGGTTVNAFSAATCTATTTSLNGVIFAITNPGAYTVAPTSLSFTGGTSGTGASATLGTIKATNTVQFQTSVAGMNGLSSNTPDVSGQISGSMVLTNYQGQPAEPTRPLITPGPSILTNAVITTSPDGTFDMLFTTNPGANGGDFVSAPNGPLGKVISIPSLSLSATITGNVTAGTGNCPAGGDCVTFTPAYTGGATGLSGSWGFASSSGPTGNLPPWYFSNAAEAYISTSALTASGPQGIYKDLQVVQYGPSQVRANPSTAFFLQQGTYFGDWDGITVNNLYGAYIEVPPVIDFNIANYTPDTAQYRHFSTNVALPWVSYAGNHRTWDGMNMYNANNPLTLGPMILPGPKNASGGWSIVHFYHECWGLNTGADQVWTGGGFNIEYASFTQCGGATFGPEIIWAAGASVVTGGIGGPSSPTPGTAGLQLLGSGNIFQNIGLSNATGITGAQVNDNGVGNRIVGNLNTVKLPVISNTARCTPGEFDGSGLFSYAANPFTSICSLILDWTTSSILGAGAGNASWLSNSDASTFGLTGTNFSNGFAFNGSGFGGFDLGALGEPFAVGSRVPVGTMNVVSQLATGATGTVTVNVLDVTANANLVNCTYTIGAAGAIALHGYLGSADPCSFTTTSAQVGHILEIGVGSAPPGGPLFHSFTALVPVKPNYQVTTCTMAAAMTCTTPALGYGYTNTPICSASQVSGTPTSGTPSAYNSSTRIFTVTALASNSSEWVVRCDGNPN